MAWTFEFTRKAQKQFDALDSAVQSRINKVLFETVFVDPKFNRDLSVIRNPQDLKS